jgi:hypothetical protein
MVGMQGRGRGGPVAGLAFATAVLLLPWEASALPLFAREGGESCAACHAGSRATEKIGGFVPALSVNNGAADGPFGHAPRYVPLSLLLDSRLGNYGGSLDTQGRYGMPEPRNLTLDGFWLPTRRMRLGAQYTIFNRVDSPAEAADGTRAGSPFLYLRRNY